MSFDADLALMLADGEDTISIGGVSTPCKVWTHDEEMGGSAQSKGQLLGMSYVLLRASQFPSLTTNTPVLVNGKPFNVGTMMRIHDGLTLHVMLGVN